MPLMLIIGYEQIMVIQTLMPLRKDKAILYNSILGATTGVLMNVLLVSTYKSIGSSIVWVTSELVVLTTSQFFVYKCIKMPFPSKQLIKNIQYHIPLFICIYAIHLMNINEFMSITLGGGITFIYCFILQVFIIKNENVVQLYHKIIKH